MMNPTSLYVTTYQLILKSNPDNPRSWEDLYRLVPYLRNSLCCVVCGNLLVDPQSPSGGRCQHHICRNCVGGRKKIKPMCAECKNCVDHYDNKNLRILLQCYKQMCIALIKSVIFKGLIEQATVKKNITSGIEQGAANLISLVKEGAAFQDDEYQSKGALPKSTYSILPCVYTNNASQQAVQLSAGSLNCSKNVANSIMSKNNTALYSVMFAGTGNKITIKRKSKEPPSENNKCKIVQISKGVLEKNTFKKPLVAQKTKKGCRCGNATLTPGKLTCCGQRCPCYVESKSCFECKCKGCRNPHTPDGNKVRPPGFLPQMNELQYKMTHQDQLHREKRSRRRRQFLNSELTNFKPKPQYESPMYGQHKEVEENHFTLVGVPVNSNIFIKAPISENVLTNDVKDSISINLEKLGENQGPNLSSMPLEDKI